jgi:SNF2 family DNA or RNA helicase
MSDLKFVSTQGRWSELQSSVSKFTNDPSIKLILMANDFAAGTNLQTAASHVVFLDPIVGDDTFETQAIARVRRIGQKCDTVKLTKFIIEDTIEDIDRK